MKISKWFFFLVVLSSFSASGISIGGSAHAASPKKPTLKQCVKIMNERFGWKRNNRSYRIKDVKVTKFTFDAQRQDGWRWNCVLKSNSVVGDYGGTETQPSQRGPRGFTGAPGQSVTGPAGQTGPQGPAGPPGSCGCETQQ